MLTESDATGGWTLHEHPPQGVMLTRQMYRRQLTVWQEGSLLWFAVDSGTKTLRWGRRSTAAAAKAAAEKAARPTLTTD
ncbi:hypothetical protein ACFYV7_39120 [Nocardia suismassiliense]|uniref:Uncharacterized protein n=1 Tax=Nocardia suismassiliense TaxID=2077092 RepID=A0ABW6R7Y1_9NOCA